jgi:hypothetical protein
MIAFLASKDVYEKSLFLCGFCLSEYVGRKSRTLLTIIGIVLGVAVVLAIAITNDSTLTSIRRIFDEASGRAPLVVTSDSVTGEPFDGGTILRVSKVPGVLRAALSVSQKTLLVAATPMSGNCLLALEAPLRPMMRSSSVWTRLRIAPCAITS